MTADRYFAIEKYTTVSCAVREDVAQPLNVMKTLVEKGECAGRKWLRIGNRYVALDELLAYISPGVKKQRKLTYSEILLIRRALETYGQAMPAWAAEVDALQYAFKDAYQVVLEAE